MAFVGGSQHSFRVAHALHLIEVVKGWQVDPLDLLDGTGLNSEALGDPRALLPVPTLMALLERARRLTGESAIGLHIGLHTRATLYGHLGFALVSAPTIRDAIDLSLRYGPIITTALSVRLRVERREASLIVDEHADFGSARDIVLLSTIVALWKVSCSLTGRDLSTSTAEFALPEPVYSAKLGMSGLRMRFDRPVHRLAFDARSLDLPYTMPDPMALKLAREQCQHELDALGLNAGLPGRVRGLIAKPGGGFRGLEEIASVLKRSARTLKRQLAAQGVTFSQLREKELSERAMMLLGSADLSLTEIAMRLGYSNVTNFERAFQRWTDSTPAEQRRAIGVRHGS